MIIWPVLLEYLAQSRIATVVFGVLVLISTRSLSYLQYHSVICQISSFTLSVPNFTLNLSSTLLFVNKLLIGRLNDWMSNSEDSDETSHDEPSHLDLRRLQKLIIIAYGSERVNLKFYWFYMPICMTYPSHVIDSRKERVFTYFFLSPAFSKKSGGTLFLVFRGAWCVVRGAWRVVRGAWCVVRGAEFLVGTLSP